MSLIAKLQQQSLLQNKLQAQLAEMSYQAVNGTRQAPRNFREGTLEIGKMHFSTPQDRITKEMIMDYQKTEQERHYDDSSGTLKKYAPTGLADTLETEAFTPFNGVATGATEDDVRTYQTDFITLHNELTTLKERLRNKKIELKNKEKEFNDKDAEYKFFEKQRNEANQKWIDHEKILLEIQSNIAALAPDPSLPIPPSPHPDIAKLTKKEAEELATIATLTTLVNITLLNKLNDISTEQTRIEADYHVIEAEIDHIELTEIPDKEDEIRDKDLEVVKIKENIKSNKEEIQRVKILNKDITQRYTDKFNMANRDRFSVMQDPNESDGDYIARIRQIEGTEYKPEIYKEKAANEGNLKFMSNLRNSLRDEVKITEIVKSFPQPEEVFIINTNWKAIQEQLKIKFGINNPDKNVTDYTTEIRDVVETLQSKPFGTTLLPADSASKSSGATSTPTGPTTPLVHDDGTTSDFITTVENDALYIQNTDIGEAIWIKLAAKTAKGAVYIVFSERNAADSFKTFKHSGNDKFAFKEMLKEFKLTDAINKDIKLQLFGSSNIKDWLITHLKKTLPVVQAKTVIVQGVTMVGAGLLPNKEVITKHANFGKNIILLDKLYYKNVLSIKDKRMHSVEHLPNIKVSDTLADIIISMCKNEHPTKQTLDTLNLDERKLFDLLLYVSGLRKSRHVNKIENTSAKDANIKELKKRFKTVEAEIQAGNNNPVVKAELKEIVNKLVLYHVISQNNGKKYLQQY